jgi:hypothetical protein
MRISSMILSPTRIKAARSILILSFIISLIIVFMLIVGGLGLVYLGSTGLFGDTVKSQSVGAVGIFCGTVATIWGLRRALLAMERLGRMKASIG